MFSFWSKALSLVSMLGVSTWLLAQLTRAVLHFLEKTTIGLDDLCITPLEKRLLVTMTIQLK